MLASAMSSPASACGSFDVVLGALFCAFLISTLHHTGRHGPCDDRSLRLRVQYSCPIFTHADINLVLPIPFCPICDSQVGHASKAYCICEPGVNCQQECAEIN